MEMSSPMESEILTALQSSDYKTATLQTTILTFMNVSSKHSQHS